MAFNRTHINSADGTFSATGAAAWNASHGVTGATSGGIPYFDSATSEASSALLAQYGVVIGGGAGGAPNTVSGLTFGGSAAGTGLAVAAGTAASAGVSAFSLSQTRNYNSTVQNWITWTFTETSAHAADVAFNILAGGSGTTSIFRVGRGGDINADAGYFSSGTTGFVINNNTARFNNTGAHFDSGGLATWTSTTASSNGTPDVTLSRQGIAVLQVGTTGAGSTGSIRAKFQSSDGTAGVASFGPGAVASITVKDGIITAIS